MSNIKIIFKLKYLGRYLKIKKIYDNNDDKIIHIHNKRIQKLVVTKNTIISIVRSMSYNSSYSLKVLHIFIIRRAIRIYTI